MHALMNHRLAQLLLYKMHMCMTLPCAVDATLRLTLIVLVPGQESCRNPAFRLKICRLTQ